VTEFWRAWFARNPDAHFDAEEIIVSGDRAVVLWSIAKCATASHGTYAASNLSRCATEKSQPSCLCKG